MSRLKNIYTLFFALLLIVVLGGCSDKTDEKVQIVLINSYAKGYIGYGNFEEKLRLSFENANIPVDIKILYLNCDTYNEEDEIIQMGKLLSGIDPKETDLILMINDQTAYSSLKSNHPILRQVPVILANVNYPNESILASYADDEVYVLRDTPDFKKNIEFIKKFHDDFVKIIYNIDMTFLGDKSLSNLKESIDSSVIRMSVDRDNIITEYVYNQLNERSIKMDIKKRISNDPSELQKDFLVHVSPFRYLDGLSLLNMLAITRNDSYNNVYLLDRIDVSTRPLSQLLGIPVFTCIREGFNEKSKILGGYFASEEMSAKSIVSLVQKILSGETADQAKIQDIDKEYVIDWKVLSMYDFYDMSILPPYVRVINYPFYEKYRYELYLAEIIFILAFFALIVVLILIRRRASIERQNVEVLKQMHTKLSRSISGSNIATWSIKDGELDFDENFVKLSGLSDHKFKTKEFLKYFYVGDDSLVKEIVERSKVTDEMLIQRVRLCTVGSDYVWYEIRCSSFVSKKGETIVAGIIQNIQSVVDREQELIRAKELAEKTELKQSFLTNMSHEIRTPLNAIIGFTNILAGDDTTELDKSERDEMLGLVNKNSDLLLKLVNDVLDLSRLDSNDLEFKMQKCDLVPILKDIYATHKVIINKDLDFKLVIDDSSPIWVNIDKMRFVQVISNLLINANKFTESGSIIQSCEVNIEDSKVVISVEDSGRGIRESQLQSIFDRFYKADEFDQGTGLGLSICKVIMERLSGDIIVRSELGKGSCFIVTLPIVVR